MKDLMNLLKAFHVQQNKILFQKYTIITLTDTFSQHHIILYTFHFILKLKTWQLCQQLHTYTNYIQNYRRW